MLDAYCGCGTTVMVVEALKRKWIGIDITYQSISLILRRLEAQYGKEFEKWAVLTYSSNRAVINDKKGGDGGIDGTAYFLTGKSDSAKIVFQVKSGNVGRGDISKFNNDRTREGAELGVFITLLPPTQGMVGEASASGIYQHALMNRNYPRIQIITITEMIEQHKRLDILMSLEVLKAAQRKTSAVQTTLLSETDVEEVDDEMDENFEEEE